MLGDDFRTGVNPEHLAPGQATPAHPFPHGAAIAALALGVIAAFVIGWWFATAFIGIESARALIATAVVEWSFAYSDSRPRSQHRRRHQSNLLTIWNCSRKSSPPSKAQQFQSPRLAELRAAIDVRGRSASWRIGRLRRWMELFDSRENFIVRALDAPLMWTVQIAMAIEAWRAENGALIPRWLDAVSEIEALSALANYAWEHPADPFPAIRRRRRFSMPRTSAIPCLPKPGACATVSP